MPLRILILFPITLRRLRAQGWLAGCALLALALAAALATAIPVYADAASLRLLGDELARQEARSGRPAFAMLIRYLGGAGRPQEWGAVAAADPLVAEGLARLGLPLRGYARHARTAPLPVVVGAEPRPSLEAPLGFVSGMGGLIRIVEGRGPNETPHAPRPAPHIEVIISRAMAERVGLNVGDALTAIAPAQARSLGVALRVVGIWEPVEPKDSGWFYSPEALGELLLVGEADFGGPLAERLRGEVDQAVWFARFDGAGLSAPAARGLAGRIASLQAEVAAALPGARLEQSPATALAAFDGASAALAAQLAVFGAPTLALILGFVALVGGLMVQRQAPEIALLKTRGVRSGQILGMLALEWLLLGAAALALGAPLGLALAGLMARTGSFLQIDPDLPRLSLALAPGHLAAGAAAVLAALPAVLLPAWGAAGQTLADAQRRIARPERPPLWRRLWLDLLLLPAPLYGLYQLRGQGGLLLGAEAGRDLGAAPLLLLVPALLSLSLALLALRLLPGLFGWASVVAAGYRGGPAHAPWIGESGPGTTMRDRRLTAPVSIPEDSTVAPVSIPGGRLTEPGSLPGSRPIAAAGGRLPHHAAARPPSPARGRGGQGVGADGASQHYQTAQHPSVLSDPRGSRGGGGVRGGLRLAALIALRGLARQPGGYGGPLLLLLLTISLAVFSAAAAATLDTALRREIGYRVGADAQLIEAGESTERAGASGAPERRDIAEEARFLFVPVGEHLGVPGVAAASRVGRYGGRLAVGGAQEVQLVGVDRATLPQALRGFEPAWADGASLGELMNRLAAEPAGALVSRELLARGLAVGRRFSVQAELFGDRRAIELTVVGVIDLFPGLYPQDGPLVIADLDQIFDQMGGQYPYDVWVAYGPGADPAAVAAGVRRLGIDLVELRDAGALLREALARPERQGLFGLLSIGFVAAGGLTVLGFLATTAIGARRRLLELGILQALGMDRRAALAVLAIEQGAVLLAGLAAGVAIGLAVALPVIPALQVAAGPHPGTPPTPARLAWDAIGLAVAAPALAVALALLGLGLALARARLFAVVKLGDTV